MEESKVLEWFDQFYREFPRHVARGDALKAFTQQIKRGIEPAMMLEGAKRYAEHVRSKLVEGRFVKHPASWLRASQWLDEPDPEPSSSKPILSHRRSYASPQRRISRPLMWFLLPRSEWKPDWQEADIPPQYR